MGVSIKKSDKAKPNSTKISVPSKKGPNKEVQSAISSIGVKSSKDGTDIKEENEEGLVFGKGPFAHVGVKAGRTVNLGDYNSVKIEVSLLVPSEVTQEALDETYTFATGWVDTKMTELIEQYGPGES